MATAEEDAQHRRMLGSSDAGRHFLNLIDTRLADDPKLARDLVAAGAALGSQAPAGACAAGGKENAAPAPAFDPATALVHLKNLALLNPRYVNMAQHTPPRPLHSEHDQSAGAT